MIRRGFLGAVAAQMLWPYAAQGQTGAQAFGRGSWTALLAATAGRPAIFHFWGLTCAPCLAELPAWGRLLRDRPDTRLIAIAADPTPQSPDRLAATRADAGLAKAEHWTFDGGFSARLYFEVDPAWRGELPRTTLRTAGGEQTTILGVADFSPIHDWLDRQHT